jgi:membrane-associated protease RseP (regulator of RpoE activity)
MRPLWFSSVGLAALCLASPVVAQEPVKAAPVEVPYRLTVPKHILVRAKINGKGPFNFILDTGAPALFVSTKACKTLGVEPDRTGWGTFDTFEIEGGVVLKKARGRIDDPPQLEGMNALGLAGCELHGVIGYDILARYRIDIDFTRDKLTWTPLDWQPMPPKGLGGKAGNSLDFSANLAKVLGGLLGRKMNPDTAPRGYLGLELIDKDEIITVVAVLDGSPAAKAGLKSGDRLVKFQDRTILNVEDVRRFAEKLQPGETVKLTVQRGGEKRDLTFKTGEGL